MEILYVSHYMTKVRDGPYLFWTLGLFFIPLPTIVGLLRGTIFTCKDGWSQDGALLRTSQIFLMLTWHLVSPFFIIHARWTGNEGKLNHYSVLNSVQSVFQAFPMAVIQWCVIEGYAEIYSQGTFFGCNEWHLAIASALVSTFSIFKGLGSNIYHGRRASI